jgi:hypothetical protein
MGGLRPLAYDFGHDERFRGLQTLSHTPGALRWLTGWWRIIFFGASMLVLAMSPSSYQRDTRQALMRHIYVDTAPILWWFTVLCALLTLVITRIVVVTALSYGLSQYALEMVIRVLVLELIPLTAALFVALRCTIPNGAALAEMRRIGHFYALLRQDRPGRDAGASARDGWRVRHADAGGAQLRGRPGAGLPGGVRLDPCRCGGIHACLRACIQPIRVADLRAQDPVLQPGCLHHPHGLRTV